MDPSPLQSVSLPSSAEKPEGGTGDNSSADLLMSSTLRMLLEREYRAAIALNNMGVTMLERQAFNPAFETLQDAARLMKQVAQAVGGAKKSGDGEKKTGLFETSRADPVARSTGYLVSKETTSSKEKMHLKHLQVQQQQERRLELVNCMLHQATQRLSKQAVCRRIPSTAEYLASSPYYVHPVVDNVNSVSTEDDSNVVVSSLPATVANLLNSSEASAQQRDPPAVQTVFPIRIETYDKLFAAAIAEGSFEHFCTRCASGGALQHLAPQDSVRIKIDKMVALKCSLILHNVGIATLCRSWTPSRGDDTAPRSNGRLQQSLKLLQLGHLLFYRSLGQDVSSNNHCCPMCGNPMAKGATAAPSSFTSGSVAVATEHPRLFWLALILQRTLVQAFSSSLQPSADNSTIAPHALHLARLIKGWKQARRMEQIMNLNKTAAAA